MGMASGTSPSGRPRGPSPSAFLPCWTATQRVTCPPEPPALQKLACVLLVTVWASHSLRQLSWSAWWALGQWGICPPAHPPAAPAYHLPNTHSIPSHAPHHLQVPPGHPKRPQLPALGHVVGLSARARNFSEGHGRQSPAHWSLAPIPYHWPWAPALSTGWPDCVGRLPCPGSEHTQAQYGSFLEAQGLHPSFPLLPGR